MGQFETDPARFLYGPTSLRIPQVKPETSSPMIGPHTTVRITPAATPYSEADTTLISARTAPLAAQAIHAHLNARPGVMEAIPKYRQTGIAPERPDSNWTRSVRSGGRLVEPFRGVSSSWEPAVLGA